MLNGTASGAEPPSEAGDRAWAAALGAIMKLSEKSAAAIAVALGLSFFASSVAGAAGALAVNKCSVYGYSYGKSSASEAEEVALQECGPGCSVVLHFENACGAFATDSDQHCGARGWGWAAGRNRAEEIALNECANNGGGNCAIQRWVCDGQ
jgi:hypothetical protein